MRIGKWAAVAGGWMLGAVVGVEASMSLYPPQHLLTEVVLDVTPDPVSAGDGAFYFALPLLRLGGPMNLGFTLHYNSNGARSNWDLNDLPEGGPWWWDPMATLNPNPMSGTNYWQFQIEGGQAVAFTEQPDGSWRLTDESAFGLANSPIAFQAMRTNTWAYFFDPRNGRIKMFENFTNNLWRIAAQTDRNGNALTYTYRPPTNWLEYLQPIRIEDDFGRWYEIEYATQGYNWEYFIDTVTDHAGRELRFEYETGGDISGSTVALRHVVDVRGGTNRFTYAPFTNSGTIYRAVIGGHRRPAGNTPWTQTYDALRLYSGDGGNRPVVTHQTDAYGHTIALTYDTNAHTVAAAWPDGRTNHFAHTGRHLPPAEATDPAGGQTLYAVNGNQQITAVTDRSGGVTGFGFDPDTRLTTAITNPSGDAMTFDYAVTTQAVVNPVTLETVEFVFHDLAARHWPDGTSETYERDGVGNVTGRVDRAGGRWSYEYDAHGNLTRRVDPAGSEENFTYTADGLRETATTAGGGTNVFAYDDLSRLTSITYPDGSALHYAYDLAGHVTAVSHSLDDAWTYEYDANGNLTSAVGPTGAEKVYAYDLMDRMTTNAPSFAAATSFEYDVMGRLARAAAGGLTNEFQRDALGNVTNHNQGRIRRTAAYDASGRPATVARDGYGHLEIQRNVQGLVTGRVDSTGFAVQAWRDPNGVVTQTVDSLARTTAWTFADGRLVSVERPGAGADERTYADGRLSAYTDRGGSTWRYGYTPEGLLAAVTNPAGGVRQFAYDSLGRMEQVTLENGATWAYGYDARGGLAEITTPGTSTWRIARNALGQPLAVTNPAGGVETRTYTADGLPESYANTDIGVFSNTYDSLQRLVERVRPDGAATEFTYEPTNGWLETVTTPGGGVRSWSYDEYGRLSVLTDPDGVENTMGYDEHGRMTSLVARAELPLAYAFDAAGREIAQTDATGTGREVAYDEQNRPVAIAFGSVTNHYEYDAAGNLVAISNSLFGAERLLRNALGIVTSRVDALGRETRYQTDAAGNVTNLTLPGGQAIGMEFDADGNLLRLEQPDGQAEAYRYDALGGLVEWTDANGRSWTVERSPMGRVTATADPLGRTNRYAYNANGWLSLRTYPDGSTRTFHYDPDGNVTAEVVNAAGGGAVETNALVYDVRGKLVAADGLGLVRDTLGRVAQTVCHGETNAAAFDAAGRLAALEYGDTMTVTYQYDPATGRLTNQVDSLTGTWVAYDYDERGRLTGMRRSNGQNAAYTRGEDGAVTRIADGAVFDLEYAFDANGRPASVSGEWPLEAGSLLAAGTRTWGYNAAGQVTNAGFAYNGRGQCIATPLQTLEWRGNRPAVLNGKTLTHSALDHLLEVESTSATSRLYYNLGLGDMPVREEDRLYVWSPAGKLLYFVDTALGNAPFVYHADARGSILALSDSTGAVVKAYAYDPQGRIVGETGDLVQPFTFGGEYGLLRVKALAEGPTGIPLSRSAGGPPLRPRDEEEDEPDGDLYHSLRTVHAPLHPPDLNDPNYIRDRIAVLDDLIEQEKKNLEEGQKQIEELEDNIAYFRGDPVNAVIRWMAPDTYKKGLNRHIDRAADKYNFQNHRRRQIDKYEAERQEWADKLNPPPPVTALTEEIDEKIGVYQDLIGKERRDMRERAGKIDEAEDNLRNFKTANSLNVLDWVAPGPGKKHVDARVKEIETLNRFQQHSRQQIEKYDAEIQKLESEKAKTQEVELAIRAAEARDREWQEIIRDTTEKVKKEGGSHRRGWVKGLKIIEELKKQATSDELQLAEDVEAAMKPSPAKKAPPPPPPLPLLPKNDLQDPVAAPQPKTEGNSATVESAFVEVPAFAPENFDEKAAQAMPGLRTPEEWEKLQAKYKRDFEKIESQGMWASPDRNTP
ncbi:MAG: hypothetical protein PHI39_02895 [Kiritimatiellae bacterium]|nr:hypothetical protein [Kiritimatiellia bacterium]